MMGRSHALSGAMAWAALTCAAPLVGVHPRWPAIAAGLLSTAGGALLPDSDHPEASISWTFGRISRTFTRLVHRISGGHRHATHSLAFAAVVPLIVWLGDELPGRVFPLALLFVLFAFGLRALHLARSLAPLGAFLITIVVGVTMRGDLGWLPWSVAVGILAHLVGDCLTKEGCPLLWPRPRHWMLPLIRRTGNRVETMLVAPACMLATVALLAFGR